MYCLCHRLTGCVQTAQGPWRSSRNKLGATAQATHSEWAVEREFAIAKTPTLLKFLLSFSLPSIKAI
jgi:hypothetical protein